MRADHSKEECALHPYRAVPVVQLRDPEGRRPAELRKKILRGGPRYAWKRHILTIRACMLKMLRGAQEEGVQGQ